MANPTLPGGLVPSRMLDGSVATGNVHKYLVAASGSAIGIGDLVTKVAGANTAIVTTAQGTYPIGTLESVNLAALGTAVALTGVVVGFDTIASAPGALYVPASVAANTYVVHVADSSKQAFYVRDDGVQTLTYAAVGKGAFFIAGAAISASTGLSNTMLDSGGTNALVTSGTTANCVILRGVPDPVQNVIGGINALWEVRLLNHTEAEGVGAAAV